MEHLGRGPVDQGMMGRTLAHSPPSQNSKTVLSIIKKGPVGKPRTHHSGRPRPPSQSSKMVLVSVHGGGPKWIVGGTVFEMWLGDL